MEEDKPQNRTSIWSVLNRYWGPFVWVLIIFLIIWTALFAASYDFSVKGSYGDVAHPFKSSSLIAPTLIFVRVYTSFTIPALMTVAIAFVLVMDGKENARMTITKWLRQKVEDEQIEKAKAEVNKVWQAWNRRRQDAERNNQPFDEPPPRF